MIRPALMKNQSKNPGTHLRVHKLFLTIVTPSWCPRLVLLLHLSFLICFCTSLYAFFLNVHPPCFYLCYCLFLAFSVSSELHSLCWPVFLTADSSATSRTTPSASLSISVPGLKPVQASKGLYFVPAYHNEDEGSDLGVCSMQEVALSDFLEDHGKQKIMFSCFLFSFRYLQVLWY